MESMAELKSNLSGKSAADELANGYEDGDGDLPMEATMDLDPGLYNSYYDEAMVITTYDDDDEADNSNDAQTTSAATNQVYCPQDSVVPDPGLYNSYYDVSTVTTYDDDDVEEDNSNDAQTTSAAKNQVNCSQDSVVPAAAIGAHADPVQPPDVAHDDEDVAHRLTALVKEGDSIRAQMAEINALKNSLMKRRDKDAVELDSFEDTAEEKDNVLPSVVKLQNLLAETRKIKEQLGLCPDVGEKSGSTDENNAAQDTNDVAPPATEQIPENEDEVKKALLMQATAVTKKKCDNLEKLKEEGEALKTRLQGILDERQGALKRVISQQEGNNSPDRPDTLPLDTLPNNEGALKRVISQQEGNKSPDRPDTLPLATLPNNEDAEVVNAERAEEEKVWGTALAEADSPGNPNFKVDWSKLEAANKSAEKTDSVSPPATQNERDILMPEFSAEELAENDRRVAQKYWGVKLPAPAARQESNTEAPEVMSQTAGDISPEKPLSSKCDSAVDLTETSALSGDNLCLYTTALRMQTELAKMQMQMSGLQTQMRSTDRVLQELMVQITGNLSPMLSEG